MIEIADINTKAHTIEALLQERLRLRSDGLEQGLRRAGRRLPRRLRDQGEVLVKASQLAGHPKLARRIDEQKVQSAYDGLKDHLSTIDPAVVRKERLLDLGATIGFYIIAAFAALICWMWWAGYV